MKSSIENIIPRIRSIVTFLILAGQMLTSINLIYANSVSQNQNIINGSYVFSSDQLLTETYTRETPSRSINLLPISHDKFVQIVGHNSKSAALLDYYLTYRCITKQQYSLYISQNHSLRSPPTFS